MVWHHPVVTSFEIALRDIDLLDDLPWSLVIVDEVHRVKNSRSGTTRALHQFQSGVRFGLTGTAIQNNYTELWTILDWTNPKMLGSSAQWKGFVVHPLTVGQSVKASEEQRIQAIVSHPRTNSLYIMALSRPENCQNFERPSPP